MTTLIQAAELALKAMEESHPEAYRHAITALRQAIALEKMAENERELGIQMGADEPVARVVGYYAGRCVIEPLDRAMVMPDNMALYAHPQPKREWVGLTEEELSKLVSCTKWRSDESMHTYAVRACRAVEAKLREKNA